MHRPLICRGTAIRQAVEAAFNIARFTAEDSAAGLPDADTLQREPRDLDLFHPWQLDTEEAIAIAQRCERAAFEVSPQIVNSEGANVYTSSGHFMLANTRDFVGGYPYSRHSISVSPIARDASGMQRDDWYSSSRRQQDLAAPEAVGDYAARRALARLAARKLKTRQCPVLFEAPLGCGLLGNFVQAASGGALYRKASFLVDALGKEVFAKHVSLHEDPYIPLGPGSSPFDEEGVRGLKRDVVERRAEGLLPVDLFGPQARHESRPAMPAARTTFAFFRRQRQRFSKGCCAGWAPDCWSPS
jgi:PmbA protein